MIEVILKQRAVFIPHSGLAGVPWDHKKAAAIPLPSMLAPCMVAEIHAVVAASYGINVKHMKTDSRARSLSWPRQVAMYLARELTHKSLPHIGSLFGGRDHTTVMYAIKQVEKRMAKDSLYRADVEALRTALA